MTVINRIKHLINFQSSASGANSVVTCPYQFTGIGVTTLYGTNVSIGNAAPTTSVTTTSSVTNVTLISSQLFLNGNVNLFQFTLNATAAATNTLCNFKLTLQNRTSTNTNLSDIYGSLNGYNSSLVPLNGITVYADTTSTKAIIKFVANGTTNQVIQGQLVYISN
jgi:hypothetical protein